MASFEEPILKQKLWHAFTTRDGMELEAEVDIGEGRIDLAGEQSQGKLIGDKKERIGIELKADGFDAVEQINKYIQTGVLDRVYIATNDKKILDKINSGDDPTGCEMVVGTDRQIVYDIAHSIHKGKYSKDQLMNVIRSAVPDTVHNIPDRKYKGTLDGIDDIDKWILMEEYDERKGEDNQHNLISLQKVYDYFASRFLPKEVGLIHIPVTFDQQAIIDGNLFSSNDIIEPQMIRKAGHLNNSKIFQRPSGLAQQGCQTPGIPGGNELQVYKRNKEPWVHHTVWRKYGGIPEARVPNTKDSNQAYRPIDLLAFSGSDDPTDAVQNPEANKIIGIEAKGANCTFTSSGRVVNQLKGYLSTSVFSRLYLAVPATVATEANDLLNTVGLSDVGLLSVTKNGTVELVNEANEMTPKHDGYYQDFEKKKVGYSNPSLIDNEEVVSPYVTDEEEKRINSPGVVEYAETVLANEPLPDDDELEYELSHELYSKHHKFHDGDTDRSYLLNGECASLYPAKGYQTKDTVDKMKKGYTRLSITNFEVQGKEAFIFSFGGGDIKGGYVWFVGNQADVLQEGINSLQTVETVSISGQGQVIDLRQKLDHDTSLSIGTGSEIELEITTRGSERKFAQFSLGNDRAGATVVMSKKQWYDLVATIDTLIGGMFKDLPGEFTSCPRIGPSGEDTWDIGPSIEREQNPTMPFTEWKEENDVDLI